ncbi:MAG: GntR family transcriptional regulator [Spirochaetales bacterium]|jgi:DNA-binding GntR family transcriptional regulator|nr:GntR family transcriptional regulator [Spirochaetales bacterium]
MASEDILFISGADKAYETIYKAIICGELLPGTKLSRRKMARLSGLSVIPVIEALKRLETDGLVESKPRWGSFVSIPTKEKLADQYILRETIECKAVRILTEKGLSGEQESYLRDCARALDGQEEIPDRAAKHNDFHYKLAEYTGYSSFTDVLKRIHLFFILCRAMTTRRGRSAVPLDWHARIVDAILTKDGVFAESIMKTHIYDSYQYIVEDIDAYTRNMAARRNF